MDTYSITHHRRIAGFYEAASKTHALELYAEDLGYASYAEMKRELGKAQAHRYQPDTFGQID